MMLLHAGGQFIFIIRLLHVLPPLVGCNTHNGPGNECKVCHYYRKAYKRHGPHHAWIPQLYIHKLEAALPPTCGKKWLPLAFASLVVNNEILGVVSPKRVGGDAKQAIKFAWP